MSKKAEVNWDRSSRADRHVYDLYRDTLRDMYEVTDFDGVKENFSSRSHVFLFDDMAIGQGRSVGQVFIRRPADIHRSGLDNISIILDFAGMAGERDGKTHNMHRVDAINLALPRSRSQDWLLRPDTLGFCLSHDTPGARLIAAHLRTVMDMTSELSADEGAVAIEAAVLMMGRCMGASPLDEAQASHRTMRRMAMEYIDRNLLKPNLTPAAIALAMGISRATLYRAFDAQGGVRGYIQGRRLDRARAVLLRRQGKHPTIAEIAYTHGFASDAHFSRAFRTRFAVTPGEVTPRISEG